MCLHWFGCHDVTKHAKLVCSGAALESSPIIDWPGLAYSNDVLQLQVWIHQWTESDAWL